MELDSSEDHFGDWIEAQSPERLVRIMNRALRRHGIDEMPDEDDISVALNEDIHEALVFAYVEDTFRSLEYKGVIASDGVDADGEIIWGVTHSGKSLLNGLTGAETDVYTHFNEQEAQQAQGSSSERNDHEPDSHLSKRKPRLGARIIAWTQAQVLPGSRSA